MGALVPSCLSLARTLIDADSALGIAGLLGPSCSRVCVVGW